MSTDLGTTVVAVLAFLAGWAWGHFSTNATWEDHYWDSRDRMERYRKEADHNRAMYIEAMGGPATFPVSYEDSLRLSCTTPQEVRAWKESKRP